MVEAAARRGGIMNTCGACRIRSAAPLQRSSPIRGLIGDPARDWQYSADLRALWSSRGGRQAFERFATGQLAIGCGYGFDPLGPPAESARRAGGVSVHCVHR